MLNQMVEQAVKGFKCVARVWLCSVLLLGHSDSCRRVKQSAGSLSWET